jgi:hypothetical protein
VEEDPLSAKSLRSLLHRRGACIRHLGIISSEARLNHTKELVVLEIVSRCAKQVIRQQLSEVVLGLPES